MPFNQLFLQSYQKYTSNMNDSEKKSHIDELLTIAREGLHTATENEKNSEFTLFGKRLTYGYFMILIWFVTIIQGGAIVYIELIK